MVLQPVNGERQGCRGRERRDSIDFWNEDYLLFFKRPEGGVCWLPFIDIPHTWYFRAIKKKKNRKRPETLTSLPLSGQEL